MAKSALEEQREHDWAASDYCDKLAARLKYRYEQLKTDVEKAALLRSWHDAFHFEVQPMTAMRLEDISSLLYSQPRAQAHLATVLEYPPSKWLIEQELTAKGVWPKDAQGIDVYDFAADQQLTGICFSGGGIRSATFNLGVLQGLADAKRIGQFDYLSTVSGGGYIHQFLAAWVYRDKLDKVQQKLRPVPEPPPSHRYFWPEPIRWLRRYSNYLTPKTGAFSADTWVAFAIWARNTFLNQIVLIASLMLVLLIPHFYLRTDDWGARYLLQHSWITVILIGLGFFIASCVIFSQILPQPPDRCHLTERTGLGQKGIFFAVFLPILVSVLAVCPYLYRSAFWRGDPIEQPVAKSNPPTREEAYRLKKWQTVRDIINWPDDASVVPASTRVYISHLHRLAQADDNANQQNTGDPKQSATDKKPRVPPPGEPEALANLRAWQAAYAFRWWNPITHFDDDPATSRMFCFLLGGIALLVLAASRAVKGTWQKSVVLLGIVGAVGCGCVLINLSRLVIFIVSFFLPLDHVTRLAIPLLPWLGLTIIFVSIEIAGGLIGNQVDESVREWFARLRAWSFLFCIVWFSVTASSLLGPGLVRWLFHVAKVGKAVWIGWIGTTLASVLVGKSSLVSGSPQDQNSKTKMLLNGLVLIGPPVFIVGLVLSLSWVVERALLIIEVHVPDQVLLRSAFFAFFAILALTTLLFGWRIDVNEFSLHAFYRDRIARCYAGASNPARKPNRFTGFAASDKHLRLVDLLPARFNDKRLQPLWADACASQPGPVPPQDPVYEGPFPIFCTTINLSFGQDLAYQERKGASFIFTPLLCGYDVGWTETDTSRVQFNGFAATRNFAFKEGGPLMATAVATSGAAMSPNWGFHSSPPMAFLLTIFNVRLGLWIRNSRHKRFFFPLRSRFSSSPVFGLFYLIAELFGLVNDNSAFVYLTDGGHFENMGLYELVRRHCMKIVICDAEQDGDLTFQGIGMAIRKCRIDHGAEINLPLNQLFPEHDNSHASPTVCVTGTVRYANGKIGEILYIKSVYTEALPADLINFHKEDPTFPNTSTVDQWFSESQFESYRRLGQHYINSAPVKTWFDRHMPVSDAAPPRIRRQSSLVFHAFHRPPQSLHYSCALPSLPPRPNLRRYN